MSRLDLGQEVHDRRLHRHVERGDRLVRHDHVRIARQRPRDRGALLFASRKMARLARRHRRRELDDLEQAGDATGQVARGTALQASQRAADRIAHGVTRIQGAIGVLEHHLKLALQRGAPRVDGERTHLDAVEGDAARGRDLEAAQHLRDRRFAAAGFADDRERPAARRREVDVGDRPHRCS